MKSWPNFLQETFRHPAQVSPGQAPTNNALQRTSSLDYQLKVQTHSSRSPLNFDRSAQCMRIIVLSFLLFGLTACKSTHDLSGSQWQNRLSRYSVGDGARNLVAELKDSGCPVRFNSNLPFPELEARYVLPDGDLHLVTTLDKRKNLVFAVQPFLVLSSIPVTQRLANYDKQWSEYLDDLHKK
jgi:hypothetical protein